MWVMLDHPRSAIVGISSVLEFGLDTIYSFGDCAACGVVRPMQKSIGKWEIRLPLKS